MEEHEREDQSYDRAERGRVGEAPGYGRNREEKREENDEGWVIARPRVFGF